MEFTKELSELVTVLLNNSDTHGLFIVGEPAIGKSTTIGNVLEELGVPYINLEAHTTACNLHNQLAANPSSLFVADDTDGLLNDSASIALLKSALDASAGTNGTRQISWGTSKNAAKDKMVNFTGKVILIANSVPKGKEYLALKSRFFYYSITLNREEREGLLRDAAKSNRFANNEIAIEVAEFLISNGDHLDFNQVNLRDLVHGYNIAKNKVTDWKKLLLKMTAKPEPKEVVLRLSKSETTPGTQLKEFLKTTQMGERMFWKYRLELGLKGT